MKRLLLAAVLFLLSEISFAKEKLNYTVTSDSQIQNVKGNFEAIGNVVIKVLIIILKLPQISLLMTKMPKL